MAKPKSCKNCKEKFTPEYNPLQFLCSPRCAIEYNKKAVERKEKDEWKVKKKEMVEKLKTMGDYEAVLQKEINAICRLIDEGCMCISCGNNGKPQAGHYHGRLKNPTLRFNLNNIHIQDYHCNVDLSANITGYNLGLINWYGKAYQEYVEYELPKEYPLLKWSKNDLILWTAQARAFKKDIINLDRPFNEEDRIFWRNFYNNKIGIYKNNSINM